MASPPLPDGPQAFTCSLPHSGADGHAPLVAHLSCSMRPGLFLSEQLWGQPSSCSLPLPSKFLYPLVVRRAGLWSPPSGRPSANQRSALPVGWGLSREAPPTRPTGLRPLGEAPVWAGRFPHLPPPTRPALALLDSQAHRDILLSLCGLALSSRGDNVHQRLSRKWWHSLCEACHCSELSAPAQSGVDLTCSLPSKPPPRSEA